MHKYPEFCGLNSTLISIKWIRLMICAVVLKYYIPFKVCVVVHRNHNVVEVHNNYHVFPCAISFRMSMVLFRRQKLSFSRREVILSRQRTWMILSRRYNEDTEVICSDTWWLRHWAYFDFMAIVTLFHHSIVLLNVHPFDLNFYAARYVSGRLL